MHECKIKAHDMINTTQTHWKYVTLGTFLQNIMLFWSEPILPIHRIRKLRSPSETPGHPLANENMNDNLL